MAEDKKKTVKKSVKPKAKKAVKKKATTPKRNVGKPTKMTEETIRKLEGAFSIGASDVEACFIAGICIQTLYNYQKKHPEYVERKEGLKSMVKFRAKSVVHDAIKNKSDINTARWLLEKTDDSYTNKVDVTTTETVVYKEKEETDAINAHIDEVINGGNG